MEIVKQHLFIHFLGIDKEVDGDWNIWTPDSFKTGFSYAWNRGCWIIGDVLRPQDNAPDYMVKNYIIVPDNTTYVLEVDPQLLADWSVN